MQELPAQIKQLPNKPGVYRFYSSENKLLYIGKAKNLKKRVSSYFSKQQTGKTSVLVRKIKSIEDTIVETEMDALILENSLIKKHQPKYNINLKDDKTYPYLKIINERFPRIISTRTKIKDGSTYLGPYANVNTQKMILEFLHNAFPLRTCKYNLSEENIEKKKFKACLEFHLGKCNAPCEGKESEEIYNEYIRGSKNILNGKLSTVKRFLKEKMEHFAQNLKFEDAENYKYKIELLENYQSKSTIVTKNIEDLDVFSITTKGNVSAVNYLKVNEGTICSTKTILITHEIEESEEDKLLYAIIQLRGEFKSEASNIYTNIDLTLKTSQFTITKPLLGDKLNLVRLSLRNAENVLNNKLQLKNKISRKNTGMTILAQAKKDLHLKEIPFHIECFDNSNLQGTTPVASMVCFKNSIPSKKDYRHFNIKTVVGADDFASMYEIVYRRYKRLSEERQPLPQLVVIDGGKGQLGMAVKAINDLGLHSKMTVISIAKRLEEIYYPGDQFPLMLSKKSTTLQLIQRLRNEAHRFAISFHRQKRDKVTGSELEKINGIGTETAKKLLSEFKTIKMVLNNQSMVEKLIGKSKSDFIFDYFKRNQPKKTDTK